MKFNIYHSLLVEEKPSKVFNAISLPKHLDNWWTLKSSGEPKFGVEYNLNFTDKYDWYCKVSKIEPNKSIHFKMTKSDADWNPTTFGFDLKETENGTLVEFSHVNWVNQNHHFKHSSFCWALLLNGLKNYLEKGTIVPFEERN
ncbi:SRPBCC domain-containing protein [Hyunsoonleella flava]|uniref:SRPBCC domain-containing protein n=1 Tax=Hyunsoonleella flava TaxID=2527939 RepID=A0A4Q9FKJ9_9FLAO|nr:SRPBCC domain-containing protein [Hyunsoonleella flava]TBN04858.1 SRPBCC domain-containing protein [Hyunsoonleella flava]